MQMMAEGSRYAKVGRAVSGLAAKLAGERPGLKIDANMEDLKAALGLKASYEGGSDLSTIPNALPSEYAVQLAELQSNAPPMGWNFVKRRMTKELGPDWRSMFDDLTGKQRQPRPGASSPCHGHTGRACMQPITRTCPPLLRCCLKQLKLVFGIYRRYDKAIDPSAIHGELAARLREELVIAGSGPYEPYRHMSGRGRRPCAGTVGGPVW